MRMAFDMRAPEIRRRIQEHARRQGINISMVFLRRFKDTRLLYGAMRSIQSGRTNHLVIQRWLEEHPLEEKEPEPEQIALPV